MEKYEVINAGLYIENIFMDTGKLPDIVKLTCVWR